MISDRCSRSSTPSPPPAPRAPCLFSPSASLSLSRTLTHPPPRLLLSILKDHAARSRGYSWAEPRTGYARTTWEERLASPLLSSPLLFFRSAPSLCKGIFRCFSKFLQTGLMADDCVPKVTPGENEPSDSPGPNHLGPYRERYNCSIAPCFRSPSPAIIPRRLHLALFFPLSLQRSWSCARMCADHGARAIS